MTLVEGKVAITLKYRSCYAETKSTNTESFMWVAGICNQSRATNRDSIYVTFGALNGHLLKILYSSGIDIMESQIKACESREPWDLACHCWEWHTYWKGGHVYVAYHLQLVGGRQECQRVRINDGEDTGHERLDQRNLKERTLTASRIRRRCQRSTAYSAKEKVSLITLNPLDFI
jgi:hypothetical protein